MTEFPLLEVKKLSKTNGFSSSLIPGPLSSITTIGLFRHFFSKRTCTVPTGREWSEYCKTGNKPDDIPSTPSRTYKDHGWISLGDWLGTERIATKDLKFLSFKEARDFARKLNLSTRKEWLIYTKSGCKPDNIPTAPWQTYKKSGWKGIPDWLGTGRPANKE